MTKVLALAALLAAVSGAASAAPVDITTLGAVCNDPTKGAINRTAVLAAMANPSVYVPSCPTFLGCYWTDPLTAPATVRVLSGDSRVGSRLCMTLAGTSPFMITINSPLIVRDIAGIAPIGATASPFSPYSPFNVKNAPSVQFRNVEVQGRTGIYVEDSPLLFLDDVYFSAYHDFGIVAYRANRLKVRDSIWEASALANDPSTTWGVGGYCRDCQDVDFAGNNLGATGSWGLYVDTSSVTTFTRNIYFRNNITRPTHIEGLGFNQVYNGMMLGNFVDAAAGHGDNCASVRGEPGTPASRIIIAYTKVEGCGANAFNLSEAVQFSNVIGNVALNWAGTREGYCFETNGADSQRLVVGLNNCNNLRFNMPYTMREDDLGGGKPSNNWYVGNWGIPGGSGYYGPLGAGSVKVP